MVWSELSPTQIVHVDYRPNAYISFVRQTLTQLTDLINQPSLLQLIDLSAEYEITSPNDPKLQTLVQQLVEMSSDLHAHGGWPNQQLSLCAKYGVFKWFVPKDLGGSGWSDQDVVKGYLKLASACLTTTFVITQRTGACRRIAATDNQALAQRLLPDLATGKTFATLGISHLTTSSRHLEQPILLAHPTDQGWILDGVSPWVTGGRNADQIVVGSEVDSGGQILIVVDTTLPGIEFGAPNSLVALSGSETGRVQFNQVEIADDGVLAGPAPNILTRGKNKSTGGLQTSALAIGLAAAAVEYLNLEASKPNRTDLIDKAQMLQTQHHELVDTIIALSSGQDVCSSDELRTQANSFVLRATQAALVAAKGAGYVDHSPVGRWCREALFFLVWSCPQVVRDANLCELAGISD